MINSAIAKSVESSFSFMTFCRALSSTQDKMPIFQDLFENKKLYAKPYSLLLIQEGGEEEVISLLDFLGSLSDISIINTFFNVLVDISHGHKSELVRHQALMTLQCWNESHKTYAPAIENQASDVSLALEHINLLLNECEVSDKFVESLGFYLADVFNNIQDGNRAISKCLLGLLRKAQAKESGSSIKLQAFVNALTCIDPRNIKSLLNTLVVVAKSGLCDTKALFDTWEQGVKDRKLNIENDRKNIELINRLRAVNNKPDKQTVPLDLATEIDLSEFV